MGIQLNKTKNKPSLRPALKKKKGNEEVSPASARRPSAGTQYKGHKVEENKVRCEKEQRETQPNGSLPHNRGRRINRNGERGNQSMKTTNKDEKKRKKSTTQVAMGQNSKKKKPHERV